MFTPYDAFFAAMLAMLTPSPPPVPVVTPLHIMLPAAFDAVDGDRKITLIAH